MIFLIYLTHLLAVIFLTGVFFYPYWLGPFFNPPCLGKAPIPFFSSFPFFTSQRGLIHQTRNGRESGKWSDHNLDESHALRKSDCENRTAKIGLSPKSSPPKYKVSMPPQKAQVLLNDKRFIGDFFIFFASLHVCTYLRGLQKSATTWRQAHYPFIPN